MKNKIKNIRRVKKMAFKFADYKFPVDPDFKNIHFMKMENLVNKTITIGDVVKFSTKENDDGKEKISVRFSFTMDGQLHYTYSTSYGIAGCLKNIMDSEGVIPKVPVKIVTVPTQNGKSTYAFEDVDN